MNNYTDKEYKFIQVLKSYTESYIASLLKREKAVS